jgi:hypothetical protein
MASIDIITTVGITHIELLDNPFVKKWTDHFCKMLDSYSIKYTVPPTPVYEIDPKSIPDTLQDIQNLKNEIYSINNLITDGAKFPIDPERITINNIRDDHDEGQKILNEVHRYFTTAGRSMNESTFTRGSWSDNFPSEFTWDVSYESEFFQSHALINDHIHALDRYQATSRKKQAYDKQVVNLNFSFDNKIGDCRFEEGAFHHISSQDYEYADDNEDLDVWVSNAILGKDYIEAWYDQDDPSQWDVTPINGHSGCFKINVYNRWHYHRSEEGRLIQHLVKSNEFQNWLKEHNVEYHPSMCGMPLGKVTRGKSLLNWFKIAPDDCPMSPWIKNNNNQWINRSFEVTLNV